MVANTIVNFVVSPTDHKEKDAELEKISCILDFTVRMSADLSIINHETGYLRNTNTTLKEESAVLFDEYVSDWLHHSDRPLPQSRRLG